MAGNPAAYLPACTVRDVFDLLQEISFPTPVSIKQISGGEYHKVFALTYEYVPTISDHHISSNELIVRAAGKHIPKIKNDHEVAIISWLRANTSIPVPVVLRFDSTMDNALQGEYMIMERSPGVLGTKMYPMLAADPAKMDVVLDQLVEVCLQLYSHHFQHIGGLTFNESGAIIPGPAFDENSWQVPDIKTYWPVTESYSTLNPMASGYSTFTSWLRASLECYIHGIKVHSSLHWVMEKDPGLTMLRSFLTTIEAEPLIHKMNDVPLILAHRDLHFGNILIDPVTYKITTILDWEFSEVLPFPLWRHSFLRDGNRDTDRATSTIERERLYQIWSEKMLRCGDIGEEMLAAAKWKFREQEAAWDVVNLVRCIVEVCPRNTQMEDSRRWWESVVVALEVLGVTPAA